MEQSAGESLGVENEVKHFAAFLLVLECARGKWEIFSLHEK